MPASLMDRFRLDGKVAIVTGAGRGIGAGCALAFAEQGADVVLAARTEGQLEQVAEKVRSLGRRAVVVPGSVTSREAMATIVERAIGELGRIDIVVNNAGGTGPSPFLQTSEDTFRAAFDFNVTTAFNLTQLAVPHMLAIGSGAVLNISSAAGRTRSRGFVAYGTAKAALNQLTRIMAIDLAPKIRVNAIAPGATATSALDIVMKSPQIKESMELNTPLHRLGTVEDIAIAALYLCSPASSYVTGKILDVDGGIESSNLTLGMPDL